MLIECVPNFSEGRDPRVVEALASACSAARGVTLLSHGLDRDHHRSVITFAGSPEAVLDGALRGVAAAVARIDLRRHTGVHPRIGAADVVPLVPIDGVTLDECAVLAHELGKAIWDRLKVPVYLYEAAALQPDRRHLETIRKKAPDWTNFPPDVGGPEPHPTAGFVVVGARKFLIAWNVNLKTADAGKAKTIARKIRESSGGLPCVKALGLDLPSRGLVQVSMNLTDFEITGMDAAYAAIRREAADLGVEIADLEIIGLVPRAALPAMFEIQPDQVLENRLATIR